MRDSRISLKNAAVAGVLAFLMPGAGHWYQGRRFKATIYSVCILTVFIWGMILGNWQPVYSQLVYRGRAESAQLEKTVPQMKFSFGYAAQCLVGIPALPSLLQEARFRNEQVNLNLLDAEIDSDFTGIIKDRGENHESRLVISGIVTIAPVNPEGSREITGMLRGSRPDGSAAEYTLGGNIEIGRAVFGSPRREIRCRVLAKNGEPCASSVLLQGTVERSFMDWFQAPRDSQELDRLHGDLSRRFDIASVFTWIAGLLNLLVIWDAVDGPAYGYGDEKPESESEDEDGKKLEKS